MKEEVFVRKLKKCPKPDTETKHFLWTTDFNRYQGTCPFIQSLAYYSVGPFLLQNWLASDRGPYRGPDRGPNSVPHVRYTYCGGRKPKTQERVAATFMDPGWFVWRNMKKDKEKSKKLNSNRFFRFSCINPFFFFYFFPWNQKTMIIIKCRGKKENNNEMGAVAKRESK